MMLRFLHRRLPQTRRAGPFAWRLSQLPGLRPASADRAISSWRTCSVVLGSGFVIAAAGMRSASATQCSTSSNPKAEVISSPAITMLMSIIRDKNTCQAEYVRAADRLMAILAEEGLARLPSVVPKVIETPCGKYNGVSAPEGHTICAVDIVRSGGILLEAVRKVMPELKTAKILIQRDEETALPKLFYSKLPPDISKLHVVLCDPMLATGGSALTAIQVLKEAGVKEDNIIFINVVSCPEGLRALAKKAPNVRIVTLGNDACLDEQKFIVPGLGDFGDRYYGTFGYAEGLWGIGGR